MRRYLSGAIVFSGLCILPLLQACSGEQSRASASDDTTASGSTSELAIPAGFARAEFDVGGMDCGGCVIGTRAALRKLQGVEQADASYDAGTGSGGAWVLYDPERVTPELMIDAMRELGYTATLSSSES